MAYHNVDLPQHIAIIMDGNGRWARQHGLPRLAGHQEGATNAHRVVGILFDHGIKYVALYIFSTENWNRPKKEVDGIFQILMDRIDGRSSLLKESGEMRLSNFLLWQAAYAEFYSTPVLWADFNCDEIDKVFIAYRERQRRFGSVAPSD
jgi:undecaprenyl pyrophosphate synthase